VSKMKDPRIEYISGYKDNILVDTYVCDRCGREISKGYKVDGKIYGIVCVKRILKERYGWDDWMVSDGIDPDNVIVIKEYYNILLKRKEESKTWLTRDVWVEKRKKERKADKEFSIILGKKRIREIERYLCNKRDKKLKRILEG